MGFYGVERYGISKLGIITRTGECPSLPKYGEEPVTPPVEEPEPVPLPLPPFNEVEIVESTPTELIAAIVISGIGIALGVFFLVIFRKALCRWDKKRLGAVTP